MGKIGTVVSLVVNVCFGVVAIFASLMALGYKEGAEDEERMRKYDKLFYEDRISCLEREKTRLKEDRSWYFVQYSELQSSYYNLLDGIKAGGTFKSGN